MDFTIQLHVKDTVLDCPIYLLLDYSGPGLLTRGRICPCITREEREMKNPFLYPENNETSTFNVSVQYS